MNKKGFQMMARRVGMLGPLAAVSVLCLAGIASPASAGHAPGDVTYVILIRCIRAGGDVDLLMVVDELQESFEDAPQVLFAATDDAVITSCPEDFEASLKDVPVVQGGIAVTEPAEFFQSGTARYEGATECWKEVLAGQNDVWHFDGGTWGVDWSAGSFQGMLLGQGSVGDPGFVPVYIIPMAVFANVGGQGGQTACNAHYSAHDLAGQTQANLASEGFGLVAGDGDVSLDALGVIVYGTSGTGAWQGDLQGCDFAYASTSSGTIDIGGTIEVRLAGMNAEGVCRVSLGPL